MFLNQLEIGPASKAREIVELDYRTAAIFDEYGIRYCCGLQRPLEEVCQEKGTDLSELLAALHKASRNISISSGTPYDNWSVDFLIDYIINIHHQYLYQHLPLVSTALDEFVREHKNRFPSFVELNALFAELLQTCPAHLKQEEDNIFPYLRQVAHAYQDGDTGSFAKLLVKTLRKPLGSFIEHEHRILSQSILRFRELTNNYANVPGACTSHKVILGKLKELDSDMVQHFYLENEVLIPKVMVMEKQL
ncbi:MAG: hypothetical protein DI535_00060 [Citrobacter freundii]|nr:MAG: hypothetical protein DI535_00060 [Citrobacter freundii]